MESCVLKNLKETFYGNEIEHFILDKANMKWLEHYHKSF